MFYETALNNHGLQLDPFKALVMPRPIGWISTVNKGGQANLAPYSFFNAFSDNPYYVAFGSSGYKHTLRNISETGEFVFNMANYALREQMNASSGSDEGDEFELAGLAKADCRLVKPPRVAASPASLECVHYQTVPLPKANGEVNDWMVIGRVVGIHIADEYIADNRVNSAAMKPIVRLGYSEYATVDSAWKMRRPD